jgi:hypothetical protein
VKLSITRGGGVAGITTRTVLDSDALSADDARTLQQRAQAVVPVAPPEDRLPDETLYRVRVEDDAATDVQYTDRTLPEDVRTLIEWADEHPARQEQIG